MSRVADFRRGKWFWPVVAAIASGIIVFVLWLTKKTIEPFALAVVRGAAREAGASQRLGQLVEQFFDHPVLASLAVSALALAAVRVLEFVNRDKPQPPPSRAAVSPTAAQCDELAQLIHEYHLALNDATRERFSREARAKLKVTTRHVSEWIRVNLGPTYHQLFESASPVVHTYTPVPVHLMRHWQLAAGKLRYLQDMAARLCG